jgi:general secretion pathway protein C
MLNFPLRHFPLLLLAALALLGLTLGHLGASLVGMRLVRAPALPPPVAVGMAVGTLRPATALLDYEIIVQRSLFAPHLAGQYSLAATPSNIGSAAPVPRSTILLLGTIAGGNRPLALIRSGIETSILHLDDTLPDGAKVIAIARQLLKLRYPDGSEQIILPPEIPGEESVNVPAATRPAIRGSSDTRFAITRAEVEKARSNLGELMKQARMEPHVVNGKTDGFEVKMIRPNTIFTALGLQVGDIVKEVNGLALDSPEKALQIFQQLREAQHIVVAIVRNNAPLSLEYNLD